MKLEFGMQNAELRNVKNPGPEDPPSSRLGVASPSLKRRRDKTARQALGLSCPQSEFLEKTRHYAVSSKRSTALGPLRLRLKA